MLNNLQLFRFKSHFVCKTISVLVWGTKRWQYQNLGHISSYALAREVVIIRSMSASHDPLNIEEQASDIASKDVSSHDEKSAGASPLTFSGNSLSEYHRRWALGHFGCAWSHAKLRLMISTVNVRRDACSPISIRRGLHSAFANKPVGWDSVARQ